MSPDISELREKENDSANAVDFYNAGEDTATTSTATSPNKKTTSPSGLSNIKVFAGRNKRKLLIGGGSVGGILGIFIALFLTLVPLKIEHIVSNLQSRFFATSQDAVQSETQKLFERYVITRVLPGYKKCGTTIKKGCTAVVSGSNPVSSLYKTWSQAKLENTLAEKYGIEFQAKANGHWVLKAPGLAAAGEDIGTDGSGLESKLVSRAGVRTSVASALDDALSKETKFTQVMTRYKFGRLLEEKYGVKRCIIFCGTKDSLADKVAAQKTAAKLFLTQRVIVPRTNSLGIALECLLSDCDTTPTDSDPNAPAANGEKVDQGVEKPVSDGLRDLASKYGVTDEVALEALQKTYNDISEKGFQKWLITEGLTKIGISEVTAGTAADTIPIAGWINMASQIVYGLDDSAGTLKKLRYVVNGTAAVSLYMMYRTYADEIHTGNVTATEVGSMVDSLGPGNNGNNNDLIVGGTASAESTPLYQSLIDNKTTVSSPSNYTCNDGKTLQAETFSSGTNQAEKLICPEESLGGGNSYANSIHSFLNLPGMNIITDLAKAWKYTFGYLFKAAGAIIGSVFSNIAKGLDAACNVSSWLLPGYCQAKDLATKEISKLTEGVTKWLIPNPFSTNMSGGRTFDMMAAGADVAGNDFAHTGLGGKALTATQTTDIINQQQQQARQELSHESLFAQMFSTGNQYSLISRIAMKVPLVSWHNLPKTLFASFLKNPFSALSKNFAAILSGKTDAATTQNDPFDVTQYGYTKSDLDKIGDPEAYWDKYCTDDASQGYQVGNSWNSAAAAAKNTDQNTGMSTNDTVNPCMLIKATVGSAGGYYDTSLLTQDDLADVNNPTNTTPTTPTNSGSDFGGTGCSGDFCTDTSITYPDVDKFLQEAQIAVNKNTSFCSPELSTCSHYCEHVAGKIWGYLGGYPSAIAHWLAEENTSHGHPGSKKIPVGALVYFNTGQYGHATVYIGNGKVVSSDIGGAGTVTVSTIDNIISKWNAPYLGWVDPIYPGTRYSPWPQN